MADSTTSTPQPICIGCDEVLVGDGKPFIVGRLCARCATNIDALCKAIEDNGLGPLTQ